MRTAGWLKVVIWEIPVERKFHMPRLIIEGGYVLTMNPEREIIRDGAVVVDGNKISWVGKQADLTDAQRGDHFHRQRPGI